MRRIALALMFAACSKGASPPPPKPEPTLAPPPVADAAPSPSPVDAAASPPDASMTTPTAPMTAASLLAELIEMSKTGMPTAIQLRDRLAPRATSQKLSGPKLEIPKWARSTSGANDIFMEMTGNVIGVRLEEDSRGWGAYAELFVNDTSLAEIEKVTGKTKFVPRNPDDFHSGETRAAYVERGDKMVRIFVELTKDGKGVQRILVHFET
ncbi:MAG TPA: hypothetical protein VMZ53_33815 [Kofleriaceae bacterium]|nr:hypothetical protein [Kofleriaceae bacterium]